MAFIISSLIVLAVWLFGMLQLHRIFSSTALVNDGNGSCIDSVHYDNATLLGITESFISCRKDFERTPQYQSFDSFRTGVSSLTGHEKESIKRSLALINALMKCKEKQHIPLIMHYFAEIRIML